MLHPRMEFHDDPLSAGFFYGSLSAGGAISVMALPVAAFPVWQLVLAGFLAMTGAAIAVGSVIQHQHREHRNG